MFPQFMARMDALKQSLLATALAMGLAGCGVSFAPLPAGSMAGRVQLYDYSPSVIQSPTLRQIWWCGGDVNLTARNQFSDSIQYEAVNLTTNAHSGPFPVLAETPGTWDSVYTCNPKVVRGSFVNPLGNNETFTYAMYYVATTNIEGLDNAIGVAFSNDGLDWKKYPHPILSPETQGTYGLGQPAVLNTDQHSAIRMFYEDTSYSLSHVEAISTDGVHFVTQGTLTTNGLNLPNLTWGDMAYDPATSYWYAAFNSPWRDLSTTGGVVERGQYGVELYRILDRSLLTGSTPWELVTTVDTNLTGYESNFLPGLMRDMYGNLISGPGIQMLTSISDPAPPWNASPAVAGESGSIDYWNVSSVVRTPDSSLAGFNRYFNQNVHEVTTGWIDPKGGFTLQAMLGHIYNSPQSGATVAFYGCKSGSMDYFVSLDIGCEGARILGTNGYAYSQPVAGLNLVALYRCKTDNDHFVSTDPKCEGQLAQSLLGYVLP
jgi:hypothetical protein